MAARQIIRAKLTALSIGAAALLWLPGGAQASAPAVYFYPAQAWSLGTGASEVAGAEVQTCSIGNQFNNGFVMQLGGSYKWVQGMSIDFRQDAFNAGEQYSVSFTVPGKLEQTVNAKATGTNLLVFDLREQKSLYAAMRDSSVVDMKIDNNNFRFYMTGFSKATAAFERCMAGGDIRTAAAETPKPQEQMPEPQAQTTEKAPAALSAAMSEDPYDIFTANESIALEEAERSSVALVEISPENPQPVVKPIPVKETTRLGDQIISEKLDMPDAPETAESAAVTQPQPLEASPASVDQAFSPPAFDAGQPRQRMSEMLAEEIENDPGIIAYKDQAPKETSEQALRTEARDMPLALPPSFGGDTPPPAAAEKNAEAMNTPVAPAVKDDIAWNGPRQTAPEAAPEASKAATEPDAPVVKVADTQDTAETVEITVAETKEALLPLRETAAAKKDAIREEIRKQAAAAREIETPKTVSPVVAEAPRVKVHKQTDFLEADFTDLPDVEPASTNMAFESYPDPDLIKKISQLELMVSDLKKENQALNEEAQAAIKDSETERLSISSDNWNLERATMRYNEAERQINRLGQQLQRERAACDMEKKDLESQLFDPQITSQQQMARLAELERELENARSKLKARGLQ